MLISYMFRPTYQFMIIIFLVWDIYFIITKETSFISKIKYFKPKLIYIPLILVIIMFIIFNQSQSNHPYNNSGGNDRTWYPYTSKSLTTNNLLSSWNWKYIEHKYIVGKCHK